MAPGKQPVDGRIVMLDRFRLTVLVLSSIIGLSSHSLAVAAPRGDKSCQGGYSSQFSLTGAVNNPATYDKESLAHLPHSIENVTFLTKTGPQSSSFGGVLLWNLLTTAGIKSGSHRHGQFQYLEITATDCYQVVVALAELEPTFGGEQILVADSQNGSPLGLDSGFARLIIPGDKFGGRDVFWIKRIEVLSSPPS
jgi:DMSO/TMAO reductase YedYZ molybdopterin-dependent catalytic subunit